jgi:hypothetical protein
METRIKTITVQATEESHGLIKNTAHRYGMNQAAVLAAMARLWERATDKQREKAMGKPLVEVG